MRHLIIVSQVFTLAALTDATLPFFHTSMAGLAWTRAVDRDNRILSLDHQEAIYSAIECLVQLLNKVVLQISIRSIYVKSP